MRSVLWRSAETNVQFGSLKMITSHFNCFLEILVITTILILISIIIIAYNLIEDLDSLPMIEPQYRFWNSKHVVIQKSLHFALLHYALEKLLQFALKDYYILRWTFYYILRQCYYILRLNILLQFASMLLHFAAIITFCGVTRFL